MRPAGCCVCVCRVTPLLSVLVCLLPAPDLALARLAVSAAAPAASAPPPQGHPIRRRVIRRSGSSDEELFDQFLMRDHRPAMETFRARKEPFMTPREHAFRDLAKRETQNRQWRCREQHRQWEIVHVFQVKLDYEDGPFPVKDPFGCRSCSGQWLPGASRAHIISLQCERLSFMSSGRSGIIACIL